MDDKLITMNKRKETILVIALCVSVTLNGILIPVYITKIDKTRNDIANMPLPNKLFYYFDYVRQNFPKGYENIDLCTYLVLHDTGQYNFFKDYTREFDKIWESENSMTEVSAAIQMFSFWKSYWKADMNASRIYNNIFGKIEYYNDTEYTMNTTQYYDYSKSVIETIYSRIGDCDDISIMTAAYLEASGYETILGTVHENETDFHHAFLWIKINFYYEYLWADLWRFGDGEYEWLLLEPTWKTSFGSTASWIAGYDQKNFTNWNDIFNWRVVAPPNDSSLELNNLTPSHVNQTNYM